MNYTSVGSGARLISRADPVKVTGALKSPSVKVIPWKTAASIYGTYGALLFSPYIFIEPSVFKEMVGVL